MIENYLSDEHWQAVAPVLPGKEGDPGCRGRDNRLFLEAVFWIVRTGSPWRSLPPQFGKWYTTYTRYHRWDRKGVWPRVVAALPRHAISTMTKTGCASRRAMRLAYPSARKATPTRASAPRSVNWSESETSYCDCDCDWLKAAARATRTLTSSVSPPPPECAPRIGAAPR